MSGSPRPSHNASAENARLRQILTGSGDAMFDWDFLEDSIVWTGPAADLFGVSSLAAIAAGDSYTRRIHAEDLALRMKALSDHYATGQPLDCEYRVRSGSGEFVWVHERASALQDDEGRPVQLLGLLRSIDKRKAYEAHLEYRAHYDDLTGQFNLARVREALEHQVNLATRYDRPSAYLLISLDRLEALGDIHGPSVVDDVLLEASQRIEHALRICDVLGRVDAAKFGIVLSECDGEVMKDVALKIRSALTRAPVSTEMGDIPCNVTIGGVPFPDMADTAQDVMIKAEAALGRARHPQANGFATYTMTPEEREARDAQMEVAQEVRRALSDRRMIFAYQPIVSAQDKAVADYECLIRMRDIHGRLVPAASFVPVVENLGLVRQLDRYCLQLAVRELSSHDDLRLALNISGLTVVDHSWLRLLVALLRGRRDVARRLTIEITETAALEDLEESARFISTARELGVRIALDDFGAGYTSFRHLKSLPVDIVKIDGAFIRNLTTNFDDQLFVRTLLGLANAFGLKTVAECVETEEIAAILTEFGVDYLQGWHFGAPDVGRPWERPTDGTVVPYPGTSVSPEQDIHPGERAASFPPVAS